MEFRHAEMKFEPIFIKNKIRLSPERLLLVQFAHLRTFWLFCLKQPKATGTVIIIGSNKSLLYILGAVNDLILPRNS